ncbi:hypothetical protein CSC46_3031 [Pseudomonas aeruginosa]|nr:hypothetical protein CSC46_3031 [Pseudomonas aeruginosa]
MGLLGSGRWRIVRGTSGAQGTTRKTLMQIIIKWIQICVLWQSSPVLRVARPNRICPRNRR